MSLPCVGQPFWRWQSSGKMNATNKSMNEVKHGDWERKGVPYIHRFLIPLNSICFN